MKAALGDVYQAWLNLPENRETKYRVEADQAAAKLADLKARLDAIPGYKRITLESFSVGRFDVTPNAAGGYYERGVKAFAGGGFEPGIYPYTPGGIHKFAEEAPEGYVSMDPARRVKSEGVWQTIGDRMGFTQSRQQQSPVPVQVSLAGAEFTLLVDGNPVRAIVQEQIVAKAKTDAVAYSGGQVSA